MSSMIRRNMRRMFVPGLAMPATLKVPYEKKLKNLLGVSSIVGLWVVSEILGTSIADAGPNGLTGTLSGTGVALANAAGPKGKLAPLFSNGYVNLYSAALNSAFNTAEGTLLIFSKLSAADVWTDGSNDCLFHIGVNGTTNYIRLLKGSGSNTLQGTYMAGSTEKTRIISSVTTTAWFVLAFTWSVSGNAAILYLNAVKQGATLTGLGTWSGALVNNYNNIGCQVATTPVLPANGWLQYALIMNRPATQPELSTISAMA